MTVPGAPPRSSAVREQPADERPHAEASATDRTTTARALDRRGSPAPTMFAITAVIRRRSIRTTCSRFPVAIVGRRQLHRAVAGRSSPRSSTSRSGSGNGSGRIRTKSVTENAAVVAPMPSATISTAVIAKPGVRAQHRGRCSAGPARGCPHATATALPITSPIVCQPERRRGERPRPAAPARRTRRASRRRTRSRNDAGYRRSSRCRRA